MVQQGVGRPTTKPKLIYFQFLGANRGEWLPNQPQKFQLSDDSHLDGMVVHI